MSNKIKGSINDSESKALVSPDGNKIVDSAAKAGSAKILPGVKKKRGSSLRQVVASFIANVGTINTGMAFGFSAIALPQLKDVNSLIQIDETQASWIASLSSVTTPIGCILSGYLMDAIGRKKILIVTQLPLIAGWILIGLATRVEMIYIGRLLVGLGSGMVGAPARVYTGEVTQPHLRGMLAAVASVGVSLGVLTEYALGAITTWNVAALLSSTVSMVALTGAFFIPESPSWLVSNGQEEKSKNALKKLRGNSCDVESEVTELINFSHKNNIHKPSFKETLEGIAKPSAYKPFIILAIYFLIYQFSGVNPVTFYAVEIFQESGAGLDKYLAAVITGIVRLVFTVVSAILLRRCGRRPLTFVSCIGCGLTMIALGSYMYYKDAWVAEDAKPEMTWIPVASVLLFTAASVIGYLVVPWVMIGEVYPTQVRGVVGGMTTCAAHFSIFIVVKTFPTFQKYLSTHGAFWFYGTLSLAGTIFFWFFLPETKGRSLQEIEDYFSGRTKSLKAPKPLNNRPPVIVPAKGNALP